MRRRQEDRRRSKDREKEDRWNRCEQAVADVQICVGCEEHEISIDLTAGLWRRLNLLAQKVVEVLVMRFAGCRRKGKSKIRNATKKKKSPKMSLF